MFNIEFPDAFTPDAYEGSSEVGGAALEAGLGGDSVAVAGGIADAGVASAVAAAASSPGVAGVGLITGAASAVLGKVHLIAPHFLGPSPSIGFLIGGLSAAAGAGVARSWLVKNETACARRLADVRAHAPSQVHASVDLDSAVLQLLASLDWSFSVDEARFCGLDAGLRCIGLSQRCNVESIAVVSERGVQRQLNRQLRRVWRLCQDPSLPTHRSTSRKPVLALSQRFSSQDVSKEQREKEAYEKLFNPQKGSVCGKRGLCAALCYLLSAFLEQRHRSQAHTSEAERHSLRLAVAALARHPFFDDMRCQPENDAQCKDHVEFLQGGALLLCFLDAALSWSPVDCFGAIGKCDDADGILMGEEKGRCCYAALAERLRKILKKALDGCKITWRRAHLHLDVLRTRSLPAPWPWVWLRAQDASMLVRNRTKVSLKVELYAVQAASGSPRADWRLVDRAVELATRLWRKSKQQPILIANVGPGIEWAMRPKVKDGQKFRMQLVTEAGVVVCSKKLRRGQSFDFDVQVPDRPAANADGIARRVCDPVQVHRKAKPIPVRSTYDGGGLGLDDDDNDTRSSLGSTMAPVGSDRRSSLASAQSMAGHWRPDAKSEKGFEDCADGAREDDVPNMECVGDGRDLSSSRLAKKATKRESEVATIVHSRGLPSASSSTATAICPRCLREMAARTTRPAVAIYAEGVRCDHCSNDLVSGRSMAPGHRHFFHCGRCWFDLCQNCALDDMRNTWWADPTKH